MNANIEFLNYIYQNCEMGTKSISEILEIVKEKDITKILKEQLKDYKMIKKEVEKKIKEYGKTPKDISKLTSIQTTVMIQVNTFLDASANHIKEMLIKGSNMGIKQINENLDKYKDADKSIIDIAKRLLKIEENNLDRLNSI